MTQCSQCGRPAMYDVAGHHLCLHCYAAFDRMNQQKIEQGMRMVNYLNAEMDAMFGLSESPRYELPEQVIQQRVVNMQNVKVDRSVVGVINTGRVQEIVANVNRINTEGNKDLSEAFTAFTEAVLQEISISNAQKQELIDQISVISTQATLPKEERKSGVLKPLIGAIGQTATTIATLSAAWTKLHPLLQHLLQ